MAVILRIACIAILLTPTLAHSQSADEVKATIKYVQRLQMPDGGFIANDTDPQSKEPASSLRATSAAVRALKYFGGEVPNREKIRTFVAACFDEKSGGFADTPKGKPDIALTAVGLMAVAELEMPAEPYVMKAAQYLVEHVESFEDARIAIAGFEAVKKLPPPDVRQKWLDTAKAMRNEDGTYGKENGLARDTGSAVAMTLRLGFAVDAKSKARQALAEGQREDGGFGKSGAKSSDLETTYRVMRAIHMLGEKPKEPAKLREFLAHCRNADGGYGVEPGKPSSVGGVYFAGSIRHWLK